MRLRTLLTGLLLAAAIWIPAAVAAPPLPNSIAAIGDSITRAAEVCCYYGDHPHQSWSTGDWPFDGIASHYERILARNLGIWGRNYNDAVSGARMRDAAAQAQAAVAQQARYVTILMGGNDVCTSSPATMTSVADFRAQFEAAMGVLAAGLPPNAHVFVSSIPNVYRLWQLFHDDPIAQLIWGAARICQSMVSPANTEEDRQFVLARERELNDVVAEVCGGYAFCRFDGDAVFEFQFGPNHVSRLDYFHPSLSGQAALAAITWDRSWWGTG